MGLSAGSRTSKTKKQAPPRKRPSKVEVVDRDTVREALTRRIAEMRNVCENCEGHGGDNCFMCADLEYRYGLDDL